MSGTTQTFKVRADSLVRFYDSLTHTLLDSGLSGARLSEVLSHCLRVECVQCHIRVSAEELQQLAVSDTPGEGLHPKLQRLRLGYCARQGCESYFYEVHMDNHPDVDWESVAVKADALLLASNTPADHAPEQRKPRRLTMYAALGLVILIVLAWLMHDHLPFNAKPHKYEIDPASTAPVSKH